MSNLRLNLDQRSSKDARLARAYAESELICEFRDRAAHERLLIDTVFQDCTFDRLRAKYEHEAKAELFDSICEAILGGEL